jgi:hypothetical protein
VRRETPGETPVELRAYGRRTFLAVTGIGLSSLLWAKPAWHVVSGATRPLANALAGRADPVLGLLALIYPATRHALRGITVGSVRRDWALEHHRKWIERDERPQ